MSDILEDIFTDSSAGRHKKNGNSFIMFHLIVDLKSHNDELNLDEFEEALKGI